jgi:glycyl-tRNA synthetase beta chain
LIPTGSEDPFALRRQALGIIAILLDKGYPVVLKELFAKAGENAKETRPTLSDEVLQFFLQRVEPLFASQNYDVDIVQSVLHLVGVLPLSAAKERLLALKEFTADAEYNVFLLAIKRINNIIPDTEIPAVNGTLLVEAPEKTLYDEVMNMKPAFQGMIRERRFSDALKLLTSLIGPINAFFDTVLVMDKREEVKLNRLSLLKEIRDMAFIIADFSKLSERSRP